MIEETAVKSIGGTVELVDKYGIIVFAVIFLFIIVYFVKRQMDTADRREKSFTESNNKFIESLNKINNSIDLRNISAKEFQNFVREEHKQMLSEHQTIISQQQVMCEKLG